MKNLRSWLCVKTRKNLHWIICNVWGLPESNKYGIKRSKIIWTKTWLWRGEKAKNILHTLWLSSNWTFERCWKPGKDPTDPKNYRPIALTICLCKLLEKMINNRLVFILKQRNLISSWQSGFRLLNFETISQTPEKYGNLPIF